MITQPTGLTLRDWADQVVLDLDGFGAFGRLGDENAWQDWAVQFLNNGTLNRSLPDPYKFANWRDWAERLVGALG
jgi:hypothetical protein